MKVWNHSFIIILLCFGILGYFQLNDYNTRQSLGASQSSPLLRLASRDGVTRDPFTRDTAPVFVPIDAQESMFPIEFEIYADETQSQLMYQGLVKPGAAHRVPYGVLSDSQTYYFRTRLLDGMHDWSNMRWFAVDNRYTGHNVFPTYENTLEAAPQPVFAVDSNNRYHMLFTEPVNGVMTASYSYSDDNGKSWNEPLRLFEDIEAEGFYPTLALDKERGILHVAWMERLDVTNSDIWYLAFDTKEPGEGLFEPIHINEAFAQPSDIIVMSHDSKGNLHFAWSGEAETGESILFYRALTMHTGNEYELSPTRIIEKSNQLTLTPSLAIAPDDSVHIAWDGGSYRFSRDGAIWEPPLTQPPASIIRNFDSSETVPGKITLVAGGTRNRSALSFIFEGRRKFQTAEGMEAYAVRSLWLTQMQEYPATTTPTKLYSIDQTMQPNDFIEIYRIKAEITPQSNIVLSWSESHSKPDDSSLIIDNKTFCAEINAEGSIGSILCLDFAIENLKSFDVTLPSNVSLNNNAAFPVLWNVAEQYNRNYDRTNTLNTNTQLLLFHGLFVDSVSWDSIRAPKQHQDFSTVTKSSSRVDLQKEHISGRDVHGISYTEKDTFVVIDNHESDPCILPYPITENIPLSAYNDPKFPRRYTSPPNTSTPTLTPTRSPTRTATYTPTLTPEVTPTQIPPTDTPTETPSLTPTQSPTFTPTEPPTSTPIPTETAVPTGTQTPEGTPVVISIPSADSYISSESENDNFGAAPLIFLQNNEAVIKESLVKFDLTQVPTNIIIIGATLRCTLDNRIPGTTLSVFPVTEAWQETYVTYATRPTCNEMVRANAVVTGASVVQIDVSEIIAWMLDEELNEGFLLRMPEVSDSVISMFSKESQSTPPELTIYYLPIPTPSPTVPPGEWLNATIFTNQSVYHGNDHFMAGVSIENLREPIIGRLYIVLDVYGFYYFYPEWQMDLSYEYRSFEAYRVFEHTFLDFTWPTGAGAGQNITFWCVCMNMSGTELRSNVTSCKFDFE